MGTVRTRKRFITWISSLVSCKTSIFYRLEFVVSIRMFAVFASILLLSIHYGQCDRTATANLQLDGTNTPIGTIKFQQDNMNSSVHVTGTLTLPNSTVSAHVCLSK